MRPYRELLELVYGITRALLAHAYIYIYIYIYHALLSIIGLFQIFQMIHVLSAIRAVCFRQCHLVVTAQQEVTPLTYWLPCQNAFTKWLPPWRKGRITCLWIKSVFRKCLHGIWFWFDNFVTLVMAIDLYEGVMHHLNVWNVSNNDGV